MMALNKISPKSRLAKLFNYSTEPDLVTITVA
jgi:hypothetical protein